MISTYSSGTRAPTPAADGGTDDYVTAFEVDAEHRLAGARYLESPHQDARPDADDISLIVVHAISLPPGEFGAPGSASYIDALFLGRLDPAAHPYFESIRTLRVSAHVCIFRDGRATQYVAFDRRAWHAGESNYQGRSRCNDFSIGIELEGCDEREFADAQYASLAAVVQALRRRYRLLTPARICGHSDIAPGRKTDPGPMFDWRRLHQALARERPL